MYSYVSNLSDIFRSASRYAFNDSLKNYETFPLTSRLRNNSHSFFFFENLNQHMDHCETISAQGVFSADKIDEHVWLGDIASSQNHQALDALNITHILTVLDFDPPRSADDRRIRKHVRAYDLNTVDLLCEFDSCYEFIDQAVRNKQNVLLHCHAGMSRSATIACAYLMKKYNLSYNEAFERLKAKRSYVFPNPGFQKQLQMFHSMKYRFDPAHSLYKKYKNRHLPVNEHSMAEENLDDVVPTALDENGAVEYKCKLCRQVVFTDADLVTHMGGKGRFDYHARGSAYKAKQNEESNSEICQQELFTSSLDWIPDVFDKDTNNGEIECPNEKCQAKLGRYSLVGEKCTCAKWVTPAFHFHRSKVDECPTKKNDQLETWISQRTVPV